MKDNRVEIKSLTSGRKVIMNRDTGFSRIIPRKGAKILISKEHFEELSYNEGFRNMVNSGSIEILNLEEEEKEMLGFEPNIIILEDDDKRRLLRDAPLDEMRKTIKEISSAQLNELVSYAIENSLIDMRRAEIIKEERGIDVLRIYRLKQQNEEVIEEEAR